MMGHGQASCTQPELFAIQFLSLHTRKKVLISWMFVPKNEVQQIVVQWFRLQHKFLAQRICQLVQQWNCCLNATSDYSRCWDTFTSEQRRRSFSCTCLMSWNYWAFINTHCLPCNVPFLGIFLLILSSALQLLTSTILSRDNVKRVSVDRREHN
jgi:hypothetical protein